MTTRFGFPFAVDETGGVAQARDDEQHLQGRIIQVLFTRPGERINQPDFGCGLFDLVFDPNNMIMAAAVEFSVGQALTRWLGGDLVVDAVDVAMEGDAVTVELAYIRRRDLTRRAVRVTFR
ncbi:GPW/gp25 family protein [Streptomyces sp. NBC_00638]|uniref:GPW/gp25 family protein n=1 Tax=unclassified Streptomyces TaxID=2593676 RepID=UPI00224DC529|nr:GPW/gp25 family protein [Streptomyces sp. NBC_00638]MCX5001193.1 GPW/gp25 family protein [Streptomyces sp. NBC_00638]